MAKENRSPKSHCSRKMWNTWLMFVVLTHHNSCKVGVDIALITINKVWNSSPQWEFQPVFFNYVVQLEFQKISKLPPPKGLESCGGGLFQIDTYFPPVHPYTICRMLKRSISGQGLGKRLNTGLFNNESIRWVWVSSMPCYLSSIHSPVLPHLWLKRMKWNQGNETDSNNCVQ